MTIGSTMHKRKNLVCGRHSVGLREYGVDLLKICAMFAIVSDHIIHWGGYGLFAPLPKCLSKTLLLEVVEAFLLCHVNCFVLASGYVMSRKEFRLNRISRLWFEVWGYSVAALIIAFLFLPEIPLGLTAVTNSLLPLSRDSYWFFTQYSCLFFLMPVFNIAVEKLDVRVLKCVLLALFVLFCMHPLFFGADLFHVNHGYSVIWFSYMYLVAATMARKNLFAGIHVRTALCIAVSCVLCTVAGRHLMHVFCRSVGVSSIGAASRDKMFWAYNSPMLTIQSIAVFVVFSRVKINSAMLRRIISFVAPSVFAVYLIHSNWIFRAATHWNQFWSSALDRTDAAESLAVVFGGAAIVFAGCLAIDFARRGAKYAMSCLFEKFKALNCDACDNGG